MILLALVALDDDPKSVTVQIMKTLLREKPSYQAPKAGEARQGEEFTVEAWEGSWAKVKLAEDRTAYIHKSAIVDRKKYVPPPAEGGEGTTAGVALGTKGFTPQMEAEHKAKLNLQRAYAKLDMMERTPGYVGDPAKLDERLAAFAQEGKLSP